MRRALQICFSAILVLGLLLPRASLAAAQSTPPPSPTPPIIQDFYVVAGYEWFGYYTGAGTADLTSPVLSYCGSDPLAAVMVLATGTVNYGFTSITYTAPTWYRANVTGEDNQTVGNALTAYFGYTISHPGSTGALSQIGLSANTWVHEVYTVCHGNKPTNSRDVAIANRIGVRTALGAYTCTSATCSIQTELRAACAPLNTVASVIRYNNTNYLLRLPHSAVWSGLIDSAMESYLGVPLTIPILSGTGDDMPMVQNNAFNVAWSICFDNTKDQAAASLGSTLLDGGMEQQPVSDYWLTDPSSGRKSFGRIDNNDWFDRLTFGLPRCQSGFQIVGSFECASALEFYCLARQDHYSDIRQRFNWPGGRMYYRFSVRGPLDHPAPFRVYAKNLSTQAITLLASGSTGPGDKNEIGSWDDYNGSTSAALLSGLYDIHLGLGSGAAENDFVYFDDIVVDVVPVSGVSCSDPLPVVTPSPTPPQGENTNNLINNCDFSEGPAYWQWAAPDAFVVYNSLNNYGHINTTASAPGIAQNFYWSGGAAFLSYDSSTAHNVFFTNLSTGEVFAGNSGEHLYSGWSTQRRSVALPAGTYKISLHLLAGAGPAEYDNVSIFHGGYGSCTSGATPVTATPPASATPYRTPSPWPTPTQRNTSTVPAGFATSTPFPSFTPYPTNTPYQSPVPTITRDPYSTPTPQPTYTRQPTYTPYPTYTYQATSTEEATSTSEAGQSTSTPRPTYTPFPTYTQPPPTSTPPMSQPPPAYYSDCRRPQSAADLAGWGEYEKCQILSFFSMSPNAVSTVQAIPTLFAGAEPFGTLGEIGETNRQMKELLDSYDMTGPGLPGVDQYPDPSQFVDGPAADSPWVTGHFEFGETEPISMQCDAHLTGVVGPLLSQGMCWFFNFMAIKGLTPWIQLFIDIAALALLAVYFWKKWIDAGAGAGG